MHKLEAKDIVKEYTSESGIRKPKILVSEIANGFRDGYYLGYQLFKRDLQASVRQSLLGFLWHFIPAIITASIWIFLNGQKVVTIQNVPMDYPAFVLTGSILWALFSESVNKPLQRFQGAKGMLTKLNFPRESLIIAAYFDVLFSAFLKLIVLVPALLLFGITPSFDWILAFLGILGLIFLGLSIGMLLVPVGMLYSDVSKGISFVLQISLYLSPVIYPMKDSGWVGMMQKLNPASSFIEIIRSSLGHYNFNLSAELILFSIIGLILFFIGIILLKLTLSSVLERIGV
ncbi:MAG: ABC transporter permease [Bacteroidetes bacterium]|nr:ABC transporter permease [Bacteroidota bacterium]